MRALALCHDLDTRLLLLTVQLGHRIGLTRVARALSRSGDGHVQVAVPVLAWFGPGEDTRAFALRCAWLFVFERLLYLILKNGLRRLRPPDCVPEFTSLVAAPDRFSLPSGHTSAAFLLAALLAQASPVLGAFALAWAGAVGLSRVVLGVHFPGDVLAGATLGLLLASPLMPLPPTLADVPLLAVHESPESLAASLWRASAGPGEIIAA